MMDQVIGGFANPGLDYCRWLALAFNLPLETVLRRAGILAGEEQAPGEEELLTYYRALSERGRRLGLALMQEIWSAENEAGRSS